MKLAYAPPPADLAEFFSVFYLFEGDDGSLNDIERASVAQFRLSYAGVGELLFDGAEPQTIPPFSIVGPRLVASRVNATGALIKVFGAGILPAGWASITPQGADKFANRIVPANQILGRRSADYMAQMAGLADLQSMVDLTASYARALFPAVKPATLDFIRTMNKWLEASLDPHIDDLANAIGISRRQAERLSNHYFGAPPKYLARMYRALRAANAIANSNSDWQDFISNAFYDQSHFIREIKYFTGLTPSAVRDHHSRLTQLAFGRHQLAGEVSSLVADS